MRKWLDLFNPLLCENYDINGVTVYENPSFQTILSLLTRGELKGQIMGNDALDVWSAMELTHFDILVNSGMHDEDDEVEDIPGRIVLTQEGVETDTEWSYHEQPFVEGRGLRLYYENESDLQLPCIERLVRRMRRRKD